MSAEIAGKILEERQFVRPWISKYRGDPAPPKELESRLSHRFHLASLDSIGLVIALFHTGTMTKTTKSIPGRIVRHLRGGSNAPSQPLMKASRSGFITSAWIVSIPCGYPG